MHQFNNITNTLYVFSTKNKTWSNLNLSLTNKKYILLRFFPCATVVLIQTVTVALNSGITMKKFQEFFNEKYSMSFLWTFPA